MKHTRNQSLRRRLRKGFSLAEVLIALAIFSVGLLSIYGLFPLAMRAANQGETVFIANQLGQKEIEFLRTLSWDDLSMENTAISNRPATTMTTTINGATSTTTYNSSIRIDPLPDDPNNIKIARVQISWNTSTPSGSKFNHVDLETLFNNPEQ